MSRADMVRWKTGYSEELTSCDKSRLILQEYMADTSSYIQDIINKRSAPRLPCSGEAVIYRPAHRNSVPLCVAWGNDISRSGISTMTRQAVYIGETFLLDLKGVVKTDLRLLIHVTHSRKLIDGIYRTGGYFLFNEK